MFLNLQIDRESFSSDVLPSRVKWAIALIFVFLTLILAWAIIDSEKAFPKAAYLSKLNLDVSGVENPVTAVLLNFRSYDTLLEIAVLFIVCITIYPAIKKYFGSKKPVLSSSNQTSLSFTNPDVNPVLIAFLKTIVPLAILVGGYLLWTGAYLPGGAFQAGSIIAGAGVALSVSGLIQVNGSTPYLRFCTSVGLLVFLIISVTNALITGVVLQYPTEYAGELILFVEIAATVTISAILLLMFTQIKQLAEDNQELHK